LTDLRELFPAGGRKLDARQAYGDLGLAQLGSGSRPYVIANMVSSVDGSATLAGKSAGISSDSDRNLFHELRTQVDAVMAGTTTIGKESYGPLVRNDELRERRIAAGLAPSPVAVTATRSMALPLDAPLLRDPGSRLFVLTNSDAPAPDVEAQLEIVRTAGETIDFGAAFERLQSEHGIGTILLEGGPTLLGAILAAGLLDELFLTITPLIAGPGGPRVIEGHSPAGLELKSVLEEQGSLFLRYVVSA
jgi:riboflavin-specific deaminase-like protein